MKLTPKNCRTLAWETIKWKLYWWATTIRDYNLPIITPLADFIRDKTWVYEDHE